MRAAMLAFPDGSRIIAGTHAPLAAPSNSRQRRTIAFLPNRIIIAKSVL
jgi:hypothetical protein